MKMNPEEETMGVLHIALLCEEEVISEKEIRYYSLQPTVYAWSDL